MTETQHLDFDAAEEAVKHAVADALRLYARLPDTMQTHVAKNRVAMALDSLETAADQLKAARTRYAEAMQDNPEEA